jgi:hypothetical protein
MEEPLYFLETLTLLGLIGYLGFAARHRPGQRLEELLIDRPLGVAQSGAALTAEVRLVPVGRLTPGAMDCQLGAADIAEVRAGDVRMAARRG